MIIGLTGLTSCGKNEIAQHLVKKYKFKHLDFAADALVDEAKNRNIVPTKESLSELGDELRKEQGRGAIVKILIKKIKDFDKDYVITGFRSPEEVDYIRNETDKFYLIFVDSKKELRFKRRGKDEPQTEEEFFDVDNKDIINKGLGAVIEMAGHKIENNSTKTELKKKVDELMKELGVSK